MVVMAAKWRGKCRVCGCVIPQGVQIEWTKEGGARHLTTEECEAASLAPPVNLDLRGPQPELPEERARVEHLLLSHAWKFAKSMPKMPHWYTLRRTWDNDEDFIWCVEYIRRVGYQERFIGRVWTYFDAGEFCYWDCGGPTRHPDVEIRVGLINRAVRRPASARAKVASGS